MVSKKRKAVASAEWIGKKKAAKTKVCLHNACTIHHTSTFTLPRCAQVPGHGALDRTLLPTRDIL
jgi:hypothetical protein